MALGLLGCGQQGRVLRDDERIRYVAHGEATADEADIELVLEQLEEMAALFGVPVPRVEYNLYPSSAEIIEFTDVCAPGREAPVAIDCFDAGRIYAGTPVQSHELVHAVVAALGGGPRILNEGLATLFGGDRDNRTDLFSVGSLRADVNLALLLSQTWTQQVDEVGSLDAYLRAADITRFLIEELGWAEFLVLLRRTQDAVTREEMAAALEASFELDEAQIEERLRAFALVPSQIPWRVLKSTSLELEEGKPGERGQHLATTFVHEAGQRTRLDVLEGSIDLIHETEGKVHVAYLATSEANATVLLDGAPGRYFVSGLARVVLSRVALTEPVEFDGGFSLGPAQLCVGSGSFRIFG
ncbi:MAG TPA: hypothetical protein VLC09_04425, partial [Polyangiaceae bacterium]|nr:hypothetical protein [Polyangiaceae bacterium]